MKEKALNNKMHLKERISLTARGFGLLKKYCPGLAQGKALSALLSSLQPFASIWFSSRIIEELSAGRRIPHLLFSAAAVITVNFTASLLKGILDKVNGEKESQMWDFFEKVFSDKQMSMDYTDLEDAGIKLQKSQAEENLFMFGNGLGQLVWGTSGLVEAAVNILVSLSLSLSLFASKAGQNLLDSPILLLLLLAFIYAGGAAHSGAVVKENKIFNEWVQNTVWYNRAFQFFGWDLYSSPERAKDLRIYGQQRVADRFLHKLIDKDKKDGGYLFRMSAFRSAAYIVSGAADAACYLYVVLKAFFGAFGIGSIVLYVGALGRLSKGVHGLTYTLSDNAVYCTHLKSLFEFLDIPNRNYQGTLPVEKRAFCEQGDNRYELEFCDVSFRYPGSNTWALRHISLKFAVGERLALVGRNGSGKSTFIKLLCRLYDPTEGEIRLNGIDVRKYRFEEYESLFSVVFQDFSLFAFSLGQNVAADTEYDSARAGECLKMAGFGERLQTMPEGLTTCLYRNYDERGVEISGGEAQKIALARALYKDAPLIILDEPTAALDPVAEYEVYKSFNEIVGDKTAVFISHRLSSCRFCSDIAVFDGGRLVTRGSHQELMEDRNGIYYELWSAQAQYYRVCCANPVID